MINLLPTELREQYIYARRNSRLRNWALGMLFGLAGVGIVATAGMLYMQQSINSYSGKVSMAEINLREQKLEETRKHSAEITSSLKLMEQVLSRQVLFSELLTQVASVMPPQTSLTDLSISNIQGSLDITAVSSNYRSATQLQVNLEDPAKKIFSKADIQNISCSPGPNTTAYPCTVTIKALFAKDNPFLFINKSSGGAER